MNNTANKNDVLKQDVVRILSVPAFPFAKVKYDNGLVIEDTRLESFLVSEEYVSAAETISDKNVLHVRPIRYGIEVDLMKLTSLPIGAQEDAVIGPFCSIGSQYFIIKCLGKEAIVSVPVNLFSKSIFSATPEGDLLKARMVLDLDINSFMSDHQSNRIVDTLDLAGFFDYKEKVHVKANVITAGVLDKNKMTVNCELENITTVLIDGKFSEEALEKANKDFKIVPLGYLPSIAHNVSIIEKEAFDIREQ